MNFFKFIIGLMVMLIIGWAIMHWFIDRVHTSTRSSFCSVNQNVSTPIAGSSATFKQFPCK